ncbi:MAG: hypothetical protein M3Q29_02115, partial [Chloroflexota bacterium]|nr:hypothetical protein [Chloroflexota bacterium]
LIERFLYQIDDPVGGFPVHGVNGLVGSIIVPIFAKQELSAFPVDGLLYGGGALAVQWLGIQTLAAVVVSALVFILSYGFVKLLSTFMQVRATYEEEVSGLDAVDHGEGAELIPVPAASNGNGNGSQTATPHPSASPLI